MKIKGFTIIEILIAIIIIGVMMAVTMSISTDRIKDFRGTSASIDFINSYEKIHNKTLTTSHNNKIGYTNTRIKFAEGLEFFEYYFDTDNNIYINKFDKMYTKDMYLFSQDKKENVNIEYLYIDIKPYSIGCLFSGDNIGDNLLNGIFYFKLQNTDTSRQYCYNIDSSNCRLQKTHIENCLDKNP